MNTSTLYDEVAVNEARLSFNNQNFQTNSLTCNYTDLHLSAAGNRWYEYYNGAITHGFIDLKKYNNKPLVVAFYSCNWGNTGLSFLRSLSAIQAEIRANGGNLLVVLPKAEQHLEQIAWLNSLTLSFYTDEQHALAHRLNLYKELSQSYTNGDDIKTLLPAVYVCDAGRNVAYKYVYRNDLGGFSAADVISAVYNSARFINKKEFI
ncbi:redoxin domain-containing protein [Mucilaginibacter roseus]|uniref:Redoxin domain-containing protein n=1 Tax=Mucilaginibacter roseus TaxID=1528868 RepID=A0ABS8TZ38_9SPHI|nr:redoxin domain-containing protein [Mucilaginibacter roseus]MCD8740126.1 redoxin domain-containing protein [Mucilaginibacter roseus]